MGRVAAAWCLTGVGGLFTFAIVRMARRGAAVVAGGLTPLEWVALVLCAGLFVYGEGERALQRRWVPRLMDRATALRNESSRWFRLLGPMYGMSLIGSSRQEVFRSWAAVGAIGVAVQAVQALPEPWRGVIDLSVAAALTWGLVGIVRATPRVFWSEAESLAAAP